MSCKTVGGLTGPPLFYRWAHTGSHFAV